MTADQITIAVTVFDRRRYLSQAISSALGQSVPVRVIVVEDCGPDLMLQRFVKEQFGTRVQYYRNTHRRGLFDNWNACMERCETAWLSILHDDDFLAPYFIATMLELCEKAPDCGLYFGETMLVDAEARQIKLIDEPLRMEWRRVGTRLFVDRNLIGFPGQLFSVQDAQAVGSFRSTSLFCGDWEMWAKLTARSGAAQIGRQVGYLRVHDHWNRGTNRTARAGKKHGLDFVQHKRVLALLKADGTRIKFDRRRFLRKQPLSTELLLNNAMFFSPRLLAYNHQLLILSTAPHWRYAGFQWLARTLGLRFLLVMSKVRSQWVTKLSVWDWLGFIVKRQTTNTEKRNGRYQKRL